MNGPLGCVVDAGHQDGDTPIIDQTRPHSNSSVNVTTNWRLFSACRRLLDQNRIQPLAGPIQPLIQTLQPAAAGVGAEWWTWRWSSIVGCECRVELMPVSVVLSE